MHQPTTRSTNLPSDNRRRACLSPLASPLAALPLAAWLAGLLAFASPSISVAQESTAQESTASTSSELEARDDATTRDDPEAVDPSPPPVVDPSLTMEPFPVYVAKEKTYARCGPAEDYYRTDPLRPGQQLEVYAETEDGWLGIRPPDDSFCWIPADAVELGSDGESGTVIEDRTVAWIGTQLGRARHYRWQVQLAEGEPIAVLGRSERQGPDGPQLWLRIVPPSGEYRWIHRDEVVFSSEELVAALQQPNDTDTEVTSGQPPTPVRRTSIAQDESRRSKRRRREEVSPVEPLLDPTLTSDEAIGSGLRQSASAMSTATKSTPRKTAEAESTSPVDRLAAAVKQSGLLPSVEFLNRPRVVEINSDAAVPNTSLATDGNWVGGGRSASGVALAAPTVRNRSGESPGAPSNVVQTSAIGPLPSQLSAEAKTNNPPTPTTIISAERISQIEQEIVDADYEQLSLVFSRLMAGGATGAETEPIERAARSLASSSSDVVAAGRARLLAERAEQYRRLAERRDGDVVIRDTRELSVPGQNRFTQAASPFSRRSAAASAANSLPAIPADGSTTKIEQPTSLPTQHGYLVQVYSARKNSPPYALTDRTGRTLAYVTPAPGVNLRTHLNSEITVTGNAGFLTGLNTPHILATDVERTPDTFQP